MRVDAEAPPKRRSDRASAAAEPEDLIGLMKSNWHEYVVELRKQDRGKDSIDGEHDSYLATLRVTSPILRAGLAVAEHGDVGRVMGSQDGCGWLGHISVIRGAMARFYKNRKLRARVDKHLKPLRRIRTEDQATEQGRIAYQKLRRIEGMGHATISRLFALTRPDKFYSLNSRSIDRLSKLFGLPKSRLVNSWDGYAAGLKTIYQTSWYQSRRPASPRMAAWWDARVALLDRYAYQEKARTRRN